MHERTLGKDTANEIGPPNKDISYIDHSMRISAILRLFVLR